MTGRLPSAPTHELLHRPRAGIVTATLVFQGFQKNQQLMPCSIAPPHPAVTSPTRLKVDKVAKPITLFSCKAKVPHLSFPAFAKALTWRKHDHHRNNDTAVSRPGNRGSENVFADRRRLRPAAHPRNGTRAGSGAFARGPQAPSGSLRSPGGQPGASRRKAEADRILLLLPGGSPRLRTTAPSAPAAPPRWNLPPDF